MTPEEIEKYTRELNQLGYGHLTIGAGCSPRGLDNFIRDIKEYRRNRKNAKEE